MPGPTTPITDREKAAISAYQFGIFPDWTTAYIAADERPKAEILTLKALPTQVSRWANSEKVRKFSDYCKRLIADREADARERGREEERRGETKMFHEDNDGDNVRTDSRRKSPVDYYDPTNQRKQINRIIAESSDDPKTQLDAIKAIQQTQRDDRQAAKDQQIQRFYTPIQCKTCPIAERERQRQAKKAGKG